MIMTQLNKRAVAAGALGLLCACQALGDMNDTMPMNGTMPAPGTESGTGGGPAVNPVPVMGEGPDAMALAELTPPYVAFADVEYSPLSAPEDGVAVEDLPGARGVPGINTTTAQQCAAACTQYAGGACNMATWVGSAENWVEMYGGRNCYLKTISESCQLPADAYQQMDTYILLKQEDCDALVPGLAPNMAEMPAGPALAPDIAAIPGTPPPLEEQALPDMTPSGAIADGSGERGLGGSAGGADTPAETPGGADSGGAMGLAGGAALALVALSALLA